MTPLLIYNAHQAELHRFAMSLCRDPHRAADLVQHTFLRVCEHAETLEGYPPARVQGWLMLTLRRAWIDRLREDGREHATNAPPEPVFHSDYTGPQVFSALDRLPQLLRDCVIMRHFQGLNATQIGLRMRVPAATVRTRLRTAARLLCADYLTDD